MAKAGEKIYVDPEIGEVTFRKSVRSRSISIRVHPVKGVSVSVPYIVPYAAAMAFLQTRRGWVLETMAKQKERFKDVTVPTGEEIEELRRRAKRELPPRLAEFASRYGFLYNRVAIKHNATNWGSCSARGNINLNLSIVRLPSLNYLRILAITPEPTVLPPSRIAKRRPSSTATGLIRTTFISMLSPGITISTPSGSSIIPVTSVVRTKN